jgi:hypothetical protein
MTGWLIIVLVAVAIEAVMAYRGRTLSQHLWDLHKRKPWTRWVTLGILVILTTHLVWRIP